MNNHRSKFFGLIRSRADKYKTVKKPVIERKIEGILNNKVLLESISAITSVLDDIPYAIIGGHAITIHGHPRTTDDIDIMTTKEYVDDIINRLGLSVSSSLTIGGVAAKTPSGTEIDIVALDEPWSDDAISNAEDTKYGRVISKPYLVLAKIYASRGISDDADSIKMLQMMSDEEISRTLDLVNKYYSSYSDDLEQMIELAKLGYEF